MAAPVPSDPIFELLRTARTIAVVGLSDNPLRPSHGVAAYLQSQGYRIIPVNPHITEVLGEKSYARLEDVPVRRGRWRVGAHAWPGASRVASELVREME